MYRRDQVVAQGSDNVIISVLFRNGLVVPSQIAGKPRQIRRLLQEIAAAPPGPRNDDSGAFSVCGNAIKFAAAQGAHGAPLRFNLEFSPTESRQKMPGPVYAGSGVSRYNNRENQVTTLPPY